jgi:8-oxo-dGTP diphosphatase
MIEKDTFNKQANFQGVKGLVFIGDKIVVYRRDDKTPNFPLRIDLPGGGIEEGESPFETFQREVKEEFGLDIKENDVQFSTKRPSFSHPGKESYFIVVVSPSMKEEDIVFGDEGLEFFLMDPKDFINLSDGIPRLQEWVAEYLDFLKREHA